MDKHVRALLYKKKGHGEPFFLTMEPRLDGLNSRTGSVHPIPSPETWRASLKNLCRSNVACYTEIIWKRKQYCSAISPPRGDDGRDSEYKKPPLRSRDKNHTYISHRSGIFVSGPLPSGGFSFAKRTTWQTLFMAVHKNVRQCMHPAPKSAKPSIGFPSENWEIELQ